MSQVVHDIGYRVEQDQLQATVRDDLTFMVAGQGGDGSLTIIALLSKVLLKRGYDIYRTGSGSEYRD